MQNAQSEQTLQVIHSQRGFMHRTATVNPAPAPYLSRAEVAQMFNVSPSTVTRWADEGKLVCIKTLGGHRRYLKESIVELVHRLQKEEASMEKITFKTPGMYGDHHTLAVQKALAQLPGIGEVQASAANREVQVTFDAAAIDAAQIQTALAAAGYPSENGHTPIPASDPHQKDPAWAQTNLRMTQTYSMAN
jgi:excisionase family DNA binding protein